MGYSRVDYVHNEYCHGLGVRGWWERVLRAPNKTRTLLCKSSQGRLSVGLAVRLGHGDGGQVPRVGRGVVHVVAGRAQEHARMEHAVGIR